MRTYKMMSCFWVTAAVLFFCVSTTFAFTSLNGMVTTPFAVAKNYKGETLMQFYTVSQFVSWLENAESNYRCGLDITILSISDERMRSIVDEMINMAIQRIDQINKATINRYVDMAQRAGLEQTIINSMIADMKVQAGASMDQIQDQIDYIFNVSAVHAGGIGAAILGGLIWFLVDRYVLTPLAEVAEDEMAGRGVWDDYDGDGLPNGMDDDDDDDGVKDEDDEYPFDPDRSITAESEAGIPMFSTSLKEIESNYLSTLFDEINANQDLLRQIAVNYGLISFGK